MAISSTSTALDTWLESAARTIITCAYADYHEDCRESDSWPDSWPAAGPGEDWMDLDLHIPPLAYALAGKLWGSLEAENQAPLETLAYRAATADEVDFIDFDLADFAHCLVMMALGHGVSWFDKHEQCNLVCSPSLEHEAGFLSFDWETYEPG